MANDEHSGHIHRHAFSGLNAREREGLSIVGRRSMLKAGLMGMAGLTLPGLLQGRALASEAGRPIAGRKAVILLWMAGGPSQIDTWDPKPDQPLQNRGPFGTIATKIPGVRICEHLPKQAAMLDKFSIIRSVDATHSNHEPNKVFQTGNRDAEPRLGPSKELYPAIGSSVAKWHGANDPQMPPYVAFMKSRSHIAFGGYLGRRYDPFIADQAADLPIYTNVGGDTGRRTGANLFRFPKGMNPDRLRGRLGLLEQLDTLRSDIDHSGAMESLGRFEREAVDLLIGSKARDAFDLKKEPEKIRELYGPHLWCQQALLARRLVESGVSFITIDLSHHTASGTWDTHGDNIPPYGGISKGLGPLLPVFDHLVTTLVGDLERLGLLDDVLVIGMGEFGRTPIMGTQGSTDGRNHWTAIMSMIMAGGGLRHGQVIGASERDGGHIKERPIGPADIAATIYRHMGVPLDATYMDTLARPLPIVENGGSPIEELFA